MGLRKWCWVTMTVGLLELVYVSPASAQGGSFIEDMFRSIAGAKAQRQADERERRQSETQRSATDGGTSQPVDVPSGFFPPRPDGSVAVPSTRRLSPRDRAPSATPRPPESRPPEFTPPTPRASARPRSISVKSQEAADFVNQLVAFATATDDLVTRLRGDSGRSPLLRASLPEAYRLSADARVLIGRCDGLSAVADVRDDYRDLDARWRKLSFDLRNIPDLPDNVRGPLKTCDRSCAAMAKVLSIRPQFDRQALRDVLIAAATHLQSLEDDLSLSDASPRRMAGLSSDCRLLRQTLIREADRVGEASYEEAVTRFSDFLGRYRDFAARISTIDDPHLQIRLDRIAQCGTETYALLWMTPPAPAVDVGQLADHLNRSVDALLGQLSFGTMYEMPKGRQNEVFDRGRALKAGCQRFLEEAGSGASRRQLIESFGEIQRSWEPLRASLAPLSTIQKASLAGVDRDLAQIGAVLGIRGVDDGQATQDELIQLAAALEGSSEYFLADIQRYERYLQPTSFRQSVSRGANDFHDQAKQLHAELSRHEDFVTVQRTTDRMLSAWENLSRDLAMIDKRGLSSSRAARLIDAQQDLLPTVARIAAALSSR